MKKTFFETEKDGFYGIYYENPKGSGDIERSNQKGYRQKAFRCIKRMAGRVGLMREQKVGCFFNGFTDIGGTGLF